MVIETDNLTKWYGKNIGCQNICLSISEGQVFGFLGPNGAGKSTLVKMLVGLIYPTAGEAKIFGKSLANQEVKKRIGFLPENFRYHDWLTGYELLLYHAELYRVPSELKKRRIDEVLNLTGLTGYEKNKVKTYSKGMQQRLGLAGALLADPDLLILDSHLLSEVEMVCDHIALIKKGNIVTQGSIDALLEKNIEVEMLVTGINQKIINELSSLGYICKHEKEQIIVQVTSKEQIPRLAETVIKNEGQLYQLKIRHNSLEDLFLELMEDGGENLAHYSQNGNKGNIE